MSARRTRKTYNCLSSTFPPPRLLASPDQGLSLFSSVQHLRLRQGWHRVVLGVSWINGIWNTPSIWSTDYLSLSLQIGTVQGGVRKPDCPLLGWGALQSKGFPLDKFCHSVCPPNSGTFCLPGIFSFIPWIPVVHSIQISLILCTWPAFCFQLCIQVHSDQTCNL